MKISKILQMTIILILVAPFYAGAEVIKPLSEKKGAAFLTKAKLDEAYQSNLVWLVDIRNNGHLYYVVDSSHKCGDFCCLEVFKVSGNSIKEIPNPFPMDLHCADGRMQQIGNEIHVFFTSIVDVDKNGKNLGAGKAFTDPTAVARKTTEYEYVWKNKRLRKVREAIAKLW